MVEVITYSEASHAKPSCHSGEDAMKGYRSWLESFDWLQSFFGIFFRSGKALPVEQPSGVVGIYLNK